MKSFVQYREDAGGAGGVGAVGAASGGAIATTTTAGIKTSVENPPMGKKAQKKYVAKAIGEQNDPDSLEQRQKSKMSSDVRVRRNADLVRTQSRQKHELDRRAGLLGAHTETPAVKAPSSGVSNRVGPQNPRKITGAVNMESFAQFHKKNAKPKAGSGVGPQAFMTKEDTVRNQKEIVDANSTTHKKPTGFESDKKVYRAPSPLKPSKD